MKKKNIFEQNPKITVFLLVSIITIAADLSVGAFFIPVDYTYFRIPHPYYHHDLLPLKESVDQWKFTKQHPIYTNSLGFKDNAVKTIPLKTSKKRVVFIGDSFTEGLGVPYEESFVGIVNSTIDHSKRDILNAGVMSYSPKLYYLKTKYLIEKVGLKFDELIVFIDTSDIQDEIYYKNFKPGEGFSVAYALNSAHKKLKNMSFFYYSITSFLNKKNNQKGINFGWDQNINLEPLKKFPNFDDKRNLWGLEKKVFDEWGKEGLALARENMKNLIALCKKNNISVTIAVYPHLSNILFQDLDSLQVQTWENFSKANGVPFVNYFPDFINEESPQLVLKKYFLLADTHWNKAGHNIIAKKMIQHFENSNE